MQAVKAGVLAALEPDQTLVWLCRADALELEAAMDVMWRYVPSKAPPRWLWLAYAFGGAKLYDQRTRKVLAYVLSSHEDEAFLELKAL